MHSPVFLAHFSWSRPHFRGVKLRHTSSYTTTPNQSVDCLSCNDRLPHWFAPILTGVLHEVCEDEGHLVAGRQVVRCPGTVWDHQTRVSTRWRRKKRSDTRQRLLSTTSAAYSCHDWYCRQQTMDIILLQYFNLPRKMCLWVTLPSTMDTFMGTANALVLKSSIHFVVESPECRYSGYLPWNMKWDHHTFLVTSCWNVHMSNCSPWHVWGIQAKETKS